MIWLLAALLTFQIWLPAVGNGAQPQADQFRTELRTGLGNRILYVDGSVGNYSNNQVRNVRVVATFYNDSIPVAPSAVLLVFAELTPGQERAFSASLGQPVAEWHEAEVGILWVLER